MFFLLLILTAKLEYFEYWNISSLIQKTRTNSKSIYPWLKTLNFTIQKGIVYTCGSIHLPYLVASIKSLRELECKLPIFILHAGPGDLPLEHQNEIKKLNVSVGDVNDYLNWDLVDVTGWFIKPFSILVSPFVETLFIDCDSFFFKNPEFLFLDKDYLSTGALFFHDRSTGHIPSLSIIKKTNLLIPHTSKSLFRRDVARPYSQHEQDSGVILINKEKSLSGLLAACSLNTWHMRDYFLNWTHGDKESFWMGFEIANQNYSFFPGYGSSIGFLHEGKTCGVLLHCDNDSLLWFNGGLYSDKSNTTDYLEFNYYTVDNNPKKANWTFKLNNKTAYCLSTNEPPKKIPKKEKKLLKRWIQLYNESKTYYSFLKYPKIVYV